MKPALLTLTLLSFLFFQPVSAQLSVGLKTGYVKAWQQYSNIELPPNAKVHVNRYQVGVQASLALSPLSTLNFEPGYTQRGAACYPGYASILRDTKMMFNYIDFPVTVTANHSFPGSKWTLFGKAGYGISKMISAARVTVDNQTGDRDNVKVNMKNNETFRHWDHGVYTGVGVSVKTGNLKLFVEADYYYGMVDVDKFAVTRNRDLSLNLGFTVPVF